MTDGSDWHDPENRPPPGRGCWFCHYGKPVVWTNAHGICAECVARWFQGWDPETAIDWTLAQIAVRTAWEQGAERRQLADEQALREWLHGR